MLPWRHYQHAASQIFHRARNQFDRISERLIIDSGPERCEDTEPALTITATNAPMMAEQILSKVISATISGWRFFCACSLVIL